MAVKDRYENIPVDKPLTMKQQLFVEAYFSSDYNATEACRKAGYNGNNLNRVASQLLAKPNVKAAIDTLAKKKLEEVSLTEQYVIKKLVRTIEKAEQDNNLAAVLRGIELAAKNLGMLRDRTEITGKDGEAIKYEEVQNEAADFVRSLSSIAKRSTPDLKVVEGGK
jgi:hypothetical protein